MEFVTTSFGSVNPRCFGTGKKEATQEIKIAMINVMKMIVKAFDLKDAVDVAITECFEANWEGKENFLYAAIREGMTIRKRQQKSFVDFEKMKTFLENQEGDENSKVLAEHFQSWVPVVLIAMKYYYFRYDASEQDLASTRTAMKKIDESTFNEKYDENDAFSVGERNFHGMMRRIFEDHVDVIKQMCKSEKHCCEVSMARMYLYVDSNFEKVKQMTYQTTKESTEASNTNGIQEKAIDEKQEEVNVQLEEKTEPMPEGPSLEKCEDLLRQAKDEESIDKTLSVLKICQEGKVHNKCVRQFKMEDLAEAEERLKQAQKDYEEAQTKVKEAEDTIKAWEDMEKSTKEQAQDLLDEKVGENT